MTDISPGQSVTVVNITSRATTVVSVTACVTVNVIDYVTVDVIDCVTVNVTMSLLLLLTMSLTICASVNVTYYVTVNVIDFVTVDVTNCVTKVPRKDLEMTQSLVGGCANTTQLCDILSLLNNLKLRNNNDQSSQAVELNWMISLLLKSIFIVLQQVIVIMTI